MHSAYGSMPGLPGAAYTCVTRRLCASFQTRACSRAPEPMTSTFIDIPPDRYRAIAVHPPTQGREREIGNTLKHGVSHPTRARYHNRAGLAPPLHCTGLRAATPL